jgi:hypothetical protein
MVSLKSCSFCVFAALPVEDGLDSLERKEGSKQGRKEGRKVKEGRRVETSQIRSDLELS